MKVRFSGQDQSGFFTDVRKQVDTYFKDNKLSKNANAAMVLKTVFFLTCFVAFYSLIMAQIGGLLGMLIFAMLLGASMSFIGFNVSHDAIHGSWSSNQTVNKVLGYTFNIIGANAYVWDIYHNQIHHTFTNIPGQDEDIDVAPGMVRLSPHDKRIPAMRYQQFYAFFLYGLSTLSWVFRKDYKKMFQKKGHAAKTYTHPRKEFYILFFSKILYYTLFIVTPLMVLDITWWQFLIGFVTMHLVMGLIIGLIFQLAHIVEGTTFPEPNDEGNIEEAWAIHQMFTTANFSTKSKVAAFLCGGLNFQIEHHLFPKICHIHYPEISKMVRSTALAHRVPYIENPTFIGALRSHFTTLKRFGRMD